MARFTHHEGVFLVDLGRIEVTGREPVGGEMQVTDRDVWYWFGTNLSADKQNHQIRRDPERTHYITWLLRRCVEMVAGRSNLYLKLAEEALNFATRRQIFRVGSAMWNQKDA
ncbi:hypothetical protein K443DRAFT_8924 [Laccaria amethystina LaAM-08-1]|uniref:Uncharacterized protein n=1 Tax=Laccaria amethystina LaAM-08-1 TaxID=1095629 RepID=A0A0C9X0T1_9AGAR|nr:hypothetical protein K443DRAFT_8924 [Laccaria amethystina LaAM-08-1]